MLIVGRALIGEPTLLLMDEPFLGLSREARDRLIGDIGGTLSGKATILLAEHDAEGAIRLLDRYVIFRNGAVVHEGTRAEVPDVKALLGLFRRYFRPGDTPPGTGENGNGSGEGR